MTPSARRTDVGPLEGDLIVRFEQALAKLAGTREANLRPLVAVLLFPLVGWVLGVLLLGMIFGLVLGVVGYARTRSYQARWAAAIPNLSVWVPTGEVAFGGTLQAHIEVVDGMGAADGLQYGLIGRSMYDGGGPLQGIRPNWRSETIYERWFPLGLTTGGLEVTIPLPDWEPSFEPLEEPEELVGPIGLRHHTRWVVAVREQRYRMDWRRSEAVVRGLSRVISTERTQWDEDEAPLDEP